MKYYTPKIEKCNREIYIETARRNDYLFPYELRTLNELWVFGYGTIEEVEELFVPVEYKSSKTMKYKGKRYLIRNFEEIRNGE